MSSNEPLPPAVIRRPEDLHTFDPLRELDWRFVRIIQMLTHVPRPRRCRASDDVWVRGMREFLLQYKHRDQWGQEQLFQQNPGPYMAQRLHSAEDERVQIYLQSRILARQSDEEIAAKIGTLPEAITWYEKIFFNVRDRFENVDWIVRSIMVPAARQGIDMSELPLKMFGYLGGPTLLEFMITGFQKLNTPQTAEEVDRYLNDYIVSGIRRRAALVSQSFRVNKYNVMQLFDLVRQVRADEVARADSDAQTSLLCNNVKAFLGEVQYMTGSDAVKRLGESSPIIYYDSQHAELRDSELQQLYRGETGGLEEIPSMRQPDPRRHIDENAKAAEQNS